MTCRGNNTDISTVIGEIYSRKLQEKSAKPSARSSQVFAGNPQPQSTTQTAAHTARTIASKKPEQPAQTSQVKLMPKSSNNYYLIKTDRKLDRQGSILIKELKSNRLISEKPEESRHKAAGTIEGAEFIEQSERSIKQEVEVSPFKTGNHHLDLHFKPTSEHFSFGRTNNGHLSNSSGGSSKASPASTTGPAHPGSLPQNLISAAHKQLSLHMMKVASPARLPAPGSESRRLVLPALKT